ncbi:MAG: PilZ domain-containing protein, partial [Alphaproteobacteria bacterium]|nr:PilZ domain-containing protein [Alphaproteobacteria bacterium]
RWNVRFDTVLDNAGQQVPCTVFDLSPSGALIAQLASDLVDAGSHVQFEMPGFGPIPAEVRHAAEGYQGLMFLLDTMGEIEVANYLLRVEQSSRAATAGEDTGHGAGDIAATEVPKGPSPAELEANALGAAGALLAAGNDQEPPRQALEDAVGALRGRLENAEALAEDLRQDRYRLGQLLASLLERIESATQVEPVADRLIARAPEGDGAARDLPPPDVLGTTAAEPVPAAAQTPPPAVTVMADTASPTEDPAPASQTPPVGDAPETVTIPSLEREAASDDDEVAVDLNVGRRYLSGLQKLKRLRAVTSDQRNRAIREEAVEGTARIGDMEYRLKNWSARGFCVGPCEITPTPGDRLDIAFTIPLPDPVLEFACRTAVMRLDKESREIGGVFFNLDEELQEIIDKHFEVAEPRRRPTDLILSLKSVVRRD